MKVNRSHYYAMTRHQPLAANDAKEQLENRLVALYNQQKQNDGSRRLGGCRIMDDSTAAMGHRLIKKQGVIVQTKLRYKNTTDSLHDLSVCENALDRKFERPLLRPPIKFGQPILLTVRPSFKGVIDDATEA